MRIIELIVGMSAVFAFAPACTHEAGPSARPSSGDPAVDFANLEVAEDFTFATRRDVQLRLEALEPQVAKYVEVSDHEGRRLFAGAVLGSMDLDFDLTSGVQQRLQVRVGRGDQARTESVSLEGGRGAVSF